MAYFFVPPLGMKQPRKSPKGERRNEYAKVWWECHCAVCGRTTKLMPGDNSVVCRCGVPLREEW